MVTLKRSARWLLVDFLGLFVAKHLAVNWGLDAIVALPAIGAEDGGSGAEAKKKAGELRETKDGGGGGGGGTSSLAAGPEPGFRRAASSSSGALALAAGKLVRHVLIGAALKHKATLDTALSHGAATCWTVSCDLASAPRTPLLSPLLELLRRFRGVVEAHVGSEAQTAGGGNVGGASAGVRFGEHSRAAALSRAWRELSRAPGSEWRHLRLAMESVSRSPPLREGFVADVVAVVLEQPSSSAPELRIYGCALGTALGELAAHGALALDGGDDDDNVDDDDNDDDGGGGGGGGGGGDEGIGRGMNLGEGDGRARAADPALLLGPSSLLLHEEALRSVASGLRAALDAHGLAALAFETLRHAAAATAAASWTVAAAEIAASAAVGERDGSEHGELSASSSAAAEPHLDALLQGGGLGGGGGGPSDDGLAAWGHPTALAAVVADTLDLLWQSALMLRNLCADTRSADARSADGPAEASRVALGRCLERFVAAAAVCVWRGPLFDLPTAKATAASCPLSRAAVLAAVFHLLAAVSAQPCGGPGPGGDHGGANGGGGAEPADEEVVVALLAEAPLEAAAEGDGPLHAALVVIAAAKASVLGLAQSRMVPPAPADPKAAVAGAAEAAADAVGRQSQLALALEGGVREATVHSLRWSLAHGEAAWELPRPVFSVADACRALLVFGGDDGPTVSSAAATPIAAAAAAAEVTDGGGGGGGGGVAAEELPNGASEAVVEAELRERRALLALAAAERLPAEYRLLADLPPPARKATLARLITVAGLGPLPRRGGIAVTAAVVGGGGGGGRRGGGGAGGGAGVDGSLCFVMDSLLSAEDGWCDAFVEEAPPVFAPCPLVAAADQGGAGRLWVRGAGEARGLFACPQGTVAAFAFDAALLAASGRDDLPFTPALPSALAESEAVPGALASVRGAGKHLAALRVAVADMRALDIYYNCLQEDVAQPNPCSHPLMPPLSLSSSCRESP